MDRVYKLLNGLKQEDVQKYMDHTLGNHAVGKPQKFNEEIWHLLSSASAINYHCDTSPYELIEECYGESKRKNNSKLINKLHSSITNLLTEVTDNIETWLSEPWGKENETKAEYISNILLLVKGLEAESCRDKLVELYKTGKVNGIKNTQFSHENEYFILSAIFDLEDMKQKFDIEFWKSVFERSTYYKDVAFHALHDSNIELGYEYLPKLVEFRRTTNPRATPVSPDIDLRVVDLGWDLFYFLTNFHQEKMSQEKLSKIKEISKKLPKKDSEILDKALEDALDTYKECSKKKTKK